MHNTTSLSSGVKIEAVTCFSLSSVKQFFGSKVSKSQRIADSVAPDKNCFPLEDIDNERISVR